MMKFIIGEGFMSQLDRFSYRGGIGFYYDSTLGGIITFLVVGLICVFAVIGFITVLKWLFWGIPKKEDPGKRWLRTGKF